MIIPYRVRRLILRTVLRDRARRLWYLDHQHTDGDTHRPLADGDAAACAYFKRNSGWWSR